MRQHRSRTPIPAAALIAVLALLAAPVFGQRSGNGMAALESIQSSFHDVAEKVIPAVVEVNTVDIIRQPLRTFSPFQFFFGRPDSEESSQEREFRRPGLGSGVIVRREGTKVYVITNNHVAGEAEEISISLHDGREFAATLVGGDANLDLALLEFETDETVPMAVLGDSEAVRVGDWAIAVGNPLGFESTMTVGIISAVGRTSAAGSDIASFTDYIQTDAAINQGNSGGALVNIKGEVVGINTWIASTSGGSIGLGFAIPINAAKKAIEDFLSKGGVEYGWLGVSIETMRIPDEIAEDLQIEGVSGVLVHGIYDDSPAEKAGLLAGDYITAVNGRPVSTAGVLQRLVANIRAGETASFEIIRFGEQRTLRVEIGARVQGSESSPSDVEVWPGMSIVKLTDQLRKQLGITKSAGAIIVGYVDSGSSAEVAGFKRGDMIQKINGETVETAMDFYQLVGEPRSRTFRFTILRDGKEITVGLKR